MQIIRVRLINPLSKEEAGCEKSPNLILEKLKEIETSEKGKIIEFEKLNLEEIHVDLENIEEASHLIYENSKEIFEKNFKAFFLGGDHSITYPILRAFNKIEENPLLIVFDAHADCILGGKYPKPGEQIRKLIENGFDAKKITIIGARNFYKEEIEFLENNKITIIKMDVLREDLDGICDLVMERARSSSGFFISIDIDGVDPAFAPGVNYPEPGGISSRDLTYFIKRLSLLENFRGGDIVNINPDKDLNGITIKLGAKLLAEMI